MRSWRCRHIKTLECRVAQPARRDIQYAALMGPWTPTLSPGWDGAYLIGELCEEDVGMQRFIPVSLCLPFSTWDVCCHTCVQREGSLRRTETTFPGGTCVDNLVAWLLDRCEALNVLREAPFAREASPSGISLPQWKRQLSGAVGRGVYEWLVGIVQLDKAFSQRCCSGVRHLQLVTWCLALAPKSDVFLWSQSSHWLGSVSKLGRKCHRLPF